MEANSIKKAYVDTPHGQLHYHYALPRDRPPLDVLVFLHKSASSSKSYVKLIEHFHAEGYACYAPDMPGFGSSFDPSETAIQEILTHGTRWYIDVFMQAFNTLGIAGPGKTFHVLGHHTGASLAIEMATVYPEAVKSIGMVGPSVMSAEERAKMKDRFFAPFNQPVRDGSHLLKTWEYLRNMGVGEDVDLHQREAIDHIRAWKGRNQIYGAIWAQDKETFFRRASCPILAMCATDDVLYPHFENVRKLRPDITPVLIGGANFSLDRDTDRIIEAWADFIKKGV
ncbi:Alpha/beta-hydrolase [Pleurostoma richardsiae]|uniref:Alpha/beta-hydrolase n=1 Tax=Pleurostoma richardsiae TaxID=41990 RepID=A0AA38VDV3_9PEZI|nr:Alpha/beta-hydrolase [Pleurostoma richardsiae]